MKAIPTFIITALLGITPGLAMSADVPQIIDRGADDDMRYYHVLCPDGSKSSISVQFASSGNSREVSEEVIRARVGNPKPPESRIIEVCVFLDKKKCSASWDLQSAAKESCK